MTFDYLHLVFPSFLMTPRNVSSFIYWQIKWWQQKKKIKCHIKKKKKNKNIVDRNASQYKKKKQKCVKSIWVLI